MDSAEFSTSHYPLMKDSGVEWLGEIPVEWEVKKLKYLVSMNDESLPEDTDERFLIKYVDISNVKSGVGILCIEELSFASAPSRARRIVREGDVIVSTVRTYLRSITKISNPPDNLIVSTGFAVIRPRRLNSDYTGYMFYSENLIGEIVSRSTGVSYPAINASDIGNIPVPVPTTEEQTAIANFLDRKTAEIDALIGQKERLLELYEEEKTAIINHAVTKGLDPNAELKDSGVEWLGEIPDDWDEVPIKRVCDVVLGKMLCSEDKGGYHEKPYLRARNIMWLKVDQDDIKKMWFSSNELRQYRLEAGDLLVSEGGEVGRTCIWNNEIAECYIQNSVHRVRFRTDKDPRYYLYLFYCLGKIGVFDAIVNRISIAHLTKEKLQQVHILKPGYNQQTAIANFLDRKMMEINAKIAKTQRIIELQKEYRTALISEVVTGKIKVPELPTQEASA